MTKPVKQHGGARKGAGRKPSDGATDLYKLTVTIRADQREKFGALGGAVWLRKMIDKAKT